MQIHCRNQMGWWGFGLLALILAGGCASLPSIQMPWKNSQGAERAQTAGPSETADDPPQTRKQAVGGSRDTGERTSSPGARTGLYWARQSVDAARRKAFAAGVESVATSNPKALSASGDSLDSPYGSWTIASANMSGAEQGGEDSKPSRPAPSPETRSVDRDADDSSAQPNAETGASTTPAATSRRSRGRSRTEGTPDAGSHGWPVGWPKGEAVDRGARTVIDPRVEKRVYHLDDSSDRSKVTETWGFSPPSTAGAVAIPGTYIQNLTNFDEFEDMEPDQAARQIAIVVPGQKITVYAGETEVATKKFPGDAELPDQLRTVRPVQVVRDGTTQLLVYWTESSEEGPTEYRIGLMKTIGPFVGTLFERTVATSTKGVTDLRRTGYLDVLRGRDHAFLQWTPAASDGSPAEGDSKVLKWNDWEGVFRVPKPPPTAPDQRS